MVTGAPGSGKSYYAVREIATALEAGKMVATNIQLSDGWAVNCARSNLVRRVIPGRVAKTAALYTRRVFITPDLEELFRVRLAGEGEARGVMVLDEAHNWINARTWDSDETGKSASKGDAVRRRLAIVRFFSQHRKLGWTVLLITQDEANIDRQVRSLFEYHVKLKNVRNFKVMGIRICPCNLFVALWFWNDKSKTRVKVQSYRLVKSMAGLYDTMALSHGLEDDELEPILLPAPEPVTVDTNPWPVRWRARWRGAPVAAAPPAPVDGREHDVDAELGPMPDEALAEWST